MLRNHILKATGGAFVKIIGTDTDAIVSTDLTLNVPAGTTLRDMAIITSNSSDNHAATLLSGFTQAGVSTEADEQLVQYIEYTSTPPASYSGFAGINNNDYTAGAIITLQGTVDVVGTMNQAVGTSVTIPSVTVTENNSLLLLFASVRRRDTNLNISSINTPSGFTLEAEAFSSDADSDVSAVAIFSKEVDAGSTGNVTFTSSAVDRLSGILIAIKAE